MKLTKKQHKDFFAFLEKMKCYVGLSDWKILLALESKELGDALANVEVCIMEKTIKIELDNSVFKESKERQSNILFHELLHGRMEVMKKIVEEYGNIEEEHFINDVVRGYEKLYTVFIIK